MSRTSRVVLNRKAMDRVELAVADGAFAVAKAVIAVARPPDAPPYGRGLIQGGGAAVWVDRKKADGTTIGGRQVKKPRDLYLDHRVTAIAGWGFPARLVNNGTEDTAAQPFFSQAAAQVEGQAKAIFRQAAAYRIARLRK